MNNLKIRTRIAPSPTGNLHIGTAHTALFNYLFARAEGGTFVVRIEDTDLERSNPAFERDILEGFAWLGIDADESPDIGGPYAPYRQSERMGSYTAALANLFGSGTVFYCFHNEEELSLEQAELRKARRPLLHLCEFRTMPREEAELLKTIKPDCIVRFKTPAGRVISFDDAIRGRVEFSSDLIGDFSIARPGGSPLYNFAVVVDDHEMEISHVIRGEDHVSNTPKQLLLIEALGWSPPIYAHLPLILGPDRSKLSKRHGTTSIDDYRRRGYLPEAMVNFMVLLGWNPGGTRELFTTDELINEFSLDRVQKSGAVFDLTKLDWMNGEYIRKKSVDELADLSAPFLQEVGSVTKNLESRTEGHGREYIKQVIALEQPRLKKLSEIGEQADYFFREPTYEKDLLRWKNMTDQDIRAALQRARDILDQHRDRPMDEIADVFLTEAAATGDRGRLLWPLRVALSGKKASAGPFEILGIIGAGVGIRRLESALDRVVIQ